MKLGHFVRPAAAAALLLLGASAHAHTQSWFGLLGPEVSGATGSGSVFIEYDSDGNTLLIQTSFAGLSGNVSVAHIHCCTAVPGSGTAGVAIQPPSLTGFPVGGTSGFYSQVFDLAAASTWSATFVTASGGTTAAATARLVNAFDSGSAYLNIHSSTFPGGEIRSFVVSTVPEPSTYALMALGLATIGGLVRRRRG